MNLPEYDFLPAPLWLLTVLHILTLSLHFLAMSFVLGGVTLMLFGKLPGRWEHPTVRRYLKLLPSIMAAAVTLGVAPLLFVQLVYPRQVYSASITSAWWWLLVIAAVIIAYYSLYAVALGRRPGSAPLWLGLALAGLLYVSLVYTSVFSLAERPELIRKLYAGNPSGWAVNAAIGLWGLRWLHMVAGAITIGGFFIGLVGGADEAARRMARVAYLWGTVITMVLGVAYIATLGDHLIPYMRSLGIWMVLVSILLSLGSLHFFFRDRMIPAGAMLVGSLFAMVINRHALRLLVLEGSFDPASIPVRPQWSVFAIFLVCLVAALGLVGWMLRAYLGSLREQAR